MTEAVVIGSGPNGLAAAVRLAQAGVDVTVLEARSTIGGGTRTEELTVPGVLHDVCSSTHPFSAVSPYLATLDLAGAGLEWCWPEIELAHPLDGGRAGVLDRSLDVTADGLGADGPAYRRLFGPLMRNLEKITVDAFAPLVGVPRHPVTFGRFGVHALQPASWVARRWKSDEARALWAGNAAHVYHPLHRPLSSSVGLMLATAAHAVGWPVAAGGSRSITDALAALLERHGGRIETGVEVTSLSDLAHADVVVADVAPAALARIAGDRLPSRVARAYRRWRYGPAAFKLDLAVQGGIPWTNEACGRAGTVHVGGTFEEIASAEADVHAGRMPERPFLLVGQQYLADPSRSAGDVHPIWAYAHVPNGYTGDATEAMLDQIERFAPGVRERIVAVAERTPNDLALENANAVGGDIIGGANTPRQILFRPRFALDPYATGIPGVYLCSASTPPGAGVHGMCGANAAASALRYLRRSA